MIESGHDPFRRWCVSLTKGAAKEEESAAMPETRKLYRGYTIEGERRGRLWRVRVRPLRPDLPILGRHSVLKPSWPEGLAEARSRIDRLLAA
jgi:hypothetical protein